MAHGKKTKSGSCFVLLILSLFVFAILQEFGLPLSFALFLFVLIEIKETVFKVRARVIV